MSDLRERLADRSDPVAGSYSDYELIGEALAEIDSLRAQLAKALAALKGLSDLYGHTWDRVDGALVMMGDSVDRFEKAHADAYDVLNPGSLTDELRAPPICEGCGQNISDPPSKLCPGCQAYQDHQR